MGIPLNVIDIFKYPLKLVKLTENLHGPGEETLALFVPRRSAVKSGWTKNAEKTKLFSSVHYILFRCIFLFDLCKFYHTLDMFICILRWLKMPRLKTLLGPVAFHFTRKVKFSRQTRVSQHTTIVKLCIIRWLNYHLPCSQPRNMAPTY
jgi:hypothetical protein